MDITGKPLNPATIAEIVEKIRAAATFIESGELTVKAAVFSEMGFRIDFEVSEDQ